jgi:methyl-accepting chemotaxis protein
VVKAISHATCRPLRTTKLRTLAESYNRFADKMREIISEVRKMSVNIAREAVMVKKTCFRRRRSPGRPQGEIANVLSSAPVLRRFRRFHEVSEFGCVDFAFNRDKS